VDISNEDSYCFFELKELVFLCTFGLFLLAVRTFFVNLYVRRFCAMAGCAIALLFFFLIRMPGNEPVDV
jgi:hypothetical protein